MAATSTLAAIVREVAAQLYPGRIVTGTTTSSVDTASVLDDNNFADSDANANQYNHVWVRIDEFITSGPSVGEAQLVTDAGYAGGTGDFTTNAFSAQVRTAMDFSLHYILKPSEVDDAVNKILTNTFHRTYHPLSLIINHDFETEATGDGDLTDDDWAASSSNTFVQTSTAARVPYGRFSGRHEVNAAGDVLDSASIKVHEGDTYFLWSTVQTDVGTAKLIARRSTATAADIETATSTQEAFTDLAFTFSIPSGCEEITARLEGDDSASDDAYWGPVVLFPQKSVIFDLPSWADETKRISGVFYFPLGETSGDSSDDNAYRPFRGDPIPLAYELYFDPLQANPRRVELDLRNVMGPIFLYGWRPFASISSPSGSATANTTLMDHDTLIEGALAECHKKVAARLDTVNPDSAETHRRLQFASQINFEKLKDTHDYAGFDTEIILPRRVPVRLT